MDSMTFALSEASRAAIDREVAKYPAGQAISAVMAGLRIAQEQNGWLSPEAIEAVANHLQIPPMAAMEVATFYNMYDVKPVGRWKVTVCTNLPCALDGIGQRTGNHAGLLKFFAASRFPFHLLN